MEITDKDRLDFLDRCNARLNAKYGTTYRWKLILNHNVNRLFIGDLAVDLNDQAPDGLPSCREAIDAEILRVAASDTLVTKDEADGHAILKDGAISFRVSLDALPAVLEGAWAIGKLDTRFQITDSSEFAKEIVRALNREDEQGTTAIHKLFDRAILDSIEQGAFGIEEHPKQVA
jgi:hypothetical protein